MTTAWAHLPNARHIDAVLADFKARPDVWAAHQPNRYSTRLDTLAQRSDAIDAAWLEVQSAERTGIVSAIWSTMHSDAPYSPVSQDSELGVIYALVAWDDSADLLGATPDVLRAMIDLANEPVCHQAALLLPYAIVRSKS